MNIDTASFDRAIRALVWPCLRDIGFSDFSKRSAWRHHADRIDVLNIQTLYQNNYKYQEADRFSFVTNVSCYLHIPSYGREPRTSVSGILRPHEADGHFRGRMGIVQRRPFLKLLRGGPAKVRKDVWLVRDDGSNLTDRVTNAAEFARSHGQAWFDQFSSYEKCIAVLENRQEEMDVLWGFGNFRSPVRHYITGYLALKHGDFGLAFTNLSEALKSDVFKEISDRIAADAKNAANHIYRNSTSGTS